MPIPRCPYCGNKGKKVENTTIMVQCDMCIDSCSYNLSNTLYTTITYKDKMTPYLNLYREHQKLKKEKN